MRNVTLLLALSILTSAPAERPGAEVHIVSGVIAHIFDGVHAPQAVAMQVRPPLLITHKPGHMFLTDWRDSDFAEA